MLPEQSQAWAKIVEHVIRYTKEKINTKVDDNRGKVLK